VHGPAWSIDRLTRLHFPKKTCKQMLYRISEKNVQANAPKKTALNFHPHQDSGLGAVLLQ
jgi:hypothetical protein